MKRIILAMLAMAIINNVMAQPKINVSVGGKQFTATLADNETAREFVRRLPVTLQMRDVNRNEKYAEFGTPFPGTRKPAGTIRIGDLKIWSGNGLVLFYESFSSSYSYYDLGSIDDVTGLVTALGSGTATVTFSVPTTGIKSTTNHADRSKQGTVYTCDGRPVARANARNGIFIVDGKKMKL